MKPGAKKIKIKDNTKTKTGLPTFENMLRKLAKEMKK